MNISSGIKETNPKINNVVEKIEDFGLERSDFDKVVLTENK